jgi:hypothetical protein
VAAQIAGIAAASSFAKVQKTLAQLAPRVFFKNTNLSIFQFTQHLWQNDPLDKADPVVLVLSRTKEIQVYVI